MGVVADLSQRAAIVPHIPRFHFLCDQLSDKGRKLLHRPLDPDSSWVQLHSERPAHARALQISLSSIERGYAKRAAPLARRARNKLKFRPGDFAQLASWVTCAVCSVGGSVFGRSHERYGEPLIL